MRRKNLRHQSQIRNESTRKCLSLLFKYKARSISELYDQCSSAEWGELLYVADINLHKHLNVALEMYIKEALMLQRNDRWIWLIRNAINFNPIEVDELFKLFNAQNIDVVKFSNHVYCLLRLIDPKINALKLVGISNSGKSLIAQLIVETFVSSYVNNHNSENEFYLSSFLNKAICICEELMITPATAEDFKSILGGAKLDISKKYTSKQVLCRTPIIITSNHSKFGRGHLNPIDEVALNNRCYIYNFITEFRPAVHISCASLAYLIYISCTMSNKNNYI